MDETRAPIPPSVPELSVIIPCFNERARVGALLESLTGYLRNRYPGRTEVIVVDDGSTDGTAEWVKTAHPDARVIVHGRNRGKGAAVRTGMLEARGARRLFMDADGATPIGEEHKLRAALDRSADVAIGSRAGAGGRHRWIRRAGGGVSPDVEGSPAGPVLWEVYLHRHLTGRVFAWLVRRLLGLCIEDTQCGFKMFTAGAAERIFRETGIDGFAFDVEVLSLARHFRYRIEEIPVHWRERAGSKVRLRRDAWWMLRDVWRASRRSKGGMAWKSRSSSPA